MKDCYVCYKEILGTVSDCTFSYKQNLSKKIQEYKSQILHESLEKYFGIKDENLSISKAISGKPYLSSYPEIQYNLSHTISSDYEHPKACIAYAFSTDAVGIDAEYLRKVKPSLAKKICSPSEYEDYLAEKASAKFLVSLWTLKEAYAKYTGEGLRINFQEFSFEKGSYLSSNVCTYFLSNHPEITLFQYELPGELFLTICTTKDTKIILKEI